MRAAILYGSMALFLSGCLMSPSIDDIDAMMAKPERPAELDTLKKHLDACLETDTPRIVVNVGDAILTSPGLSALVETHNRAGQAGGQMILCNLSREARSTLAICKFEQLFRIVTDEADALERIDAAP